MGASVKDGKIILRGEVIETRQDGDTAALIDAFIREIGRLKTIHPEAEAVGFGVPGIINPVEGVVVNLTNVKGWLASVIAGTCASAHGTAATWAVNELSHSTLLLSMMSTFSTLPFFLFTLPAGARADMVDRAKLVRLMHVLLAASSN